MVHATLLLAAMLALPGWLLACEPSPAGSPFDGLCGLVSGRCTDGPRILVLSAFPYEQHALREAADVTERLEVLDKSLLAGRLGGQRVLLRLTGIGLVNARTTTEAVLAEFDVSAIVFSGVAGSRLRIAEVAVPATWTDVASGRSFAVDPALLAAAGRVAARSPTLGQCTPYPLDPPGPQVCLPFAPGVVVGGAGSSSDPFGGGSFACQPGGDDIFGCEAHARAVTEAEPITIDAVDMETAAVADVAAAHGIPFLAVRAVSDGADDPLGLPGFPLQFFAWYRLAADNAAVVTMDLLAELPASGPTRTHRRTRRARPAAACAFERTAAPECEGMSAGRRVERLVTQACALRAKVLDGGPRAGRLATRAAVRWRRAATLVERGKLPSCCADGLARRLTAAADAASTERTTSGLDR